MSKGISLVSVLFFCFYFVYLPEFHLFPSYNSYNEQRLQELLLLLVVCAMFVLVPAGRREWLASWSNLPGTGRTMLWLVIGLGLLSAGNAVFPLFAFLEVALFAIMGVTAIGLASSRARLGYIFDWLVAVALLITGWSYLIDFIITYALTVANDMPLVQRDFFHAFVNIRFFGQFQSWTLSLMVLPLLLINRRSFYLTAFCFVPAAGWWLLLFVSGTRGTMFGCIVAFLATTAIYGRTAAVWLRLQIISIAGGFLSYLALFHLIPRLLMFDATASYAVSIFGRKFSHSSGRWELWGTAMEMIGSHPWLGIGPMHFAADGHPIAAHPHNAWLQIAAEWGLPVAALILFLFVWGMVAWVKNGGANEPATQSPNLQPSLLAALMTAATHSLFSGIIVMPVSQVMMVLVIGWMLGVAAPPLVPRQDFSFAKQGVLISVFVVTGTGILWPVLLHVPRLEDLHRQYIISCPVEQRRYFRPRLWQQGYIAPYYSGAPLCEVRHLDSLP